MAQIFNLPYQKNLRSKLRRQEIGAEKELWFRLKHDQLGFRFRRQYGIGRYIVDFYCPRLKLVIEVDGATHSTEKEIAYDIERQKYLEGLGLTVKRYNNYSIHTNVGNVVTDIYETCLELDLKFKIKN
jgi:very-short-patch-repair endonuclease